MEPHPTRQTPVAWTEVLVLAPEGWCELVGETLAVGPCTSVVFGTTSLGSEPAPAGFEHVRTFIAEALDTPQLRARIERELTALEERTGAVELRGLGVRFRRLPPEDYASSWRKSWKPFRVGNLALLTPEWSGRLRASDRRLDFEPGGAFGTGRHPTTRACLRFLQSWPLADARLLDAGSGSGLLAVAAARFGAREVVGFDNDPHARPYARHLAESNGLQDRCRFETGGFELLSELGGLFDALVANLYADLILAHAGDMARCLKPGGRFAVSGCVSARRSEVLAGLAAAGLSVTRRHTCGRWDALEGRRG